MADEKKSVSRRTLAGGQEKGRQVHGRRLTPIQARLYDALVGASAPLSAYQLLDSLNDSRVPEDVSDAPKRVYPQTVYRVLARLRQQGLVHRVESTNAWLPCRAPTRPHRGIHLLCDRCGNAQEVIDTRVSQSLDADAAQRHFHIARQVVELHGVCATCLQAEAS